MRLVASQIRTGTLHGGDVLPTARKMAETYGVASMTAQRALRELQQRGLTYASSAKAPSCTHSQSNVSASTPTDTPSPDTPTPRPAMFGRRPSCPHAPGRGYTVRDSGSVDIDYVEFELRPGGSHVLPPVPLAVNEPPGVGLRVEWQATAANERVPTLFRQVVVG